MERTRRVWRAALSGMVVAGVCVLGSTGATAADLTGGGPVQVTPPDGVASCSDLDVSVCFIDITVRQAALVVCPSYDDASGSCIGSSTGTPSWTEPGYFPQRGIQADFSWSPGPNGKASTYTANDAFTIVAAKITGHVPAASSCEFHVTSATNRQRPGVQWTTGSTGGCAQPNGPLYIDYDHPASGLGSTVHIFGYLYRSPQATGPPLTTSTTRRTTPAPTSTVAPVAAAPRFTG